VSGQAAFVGHSAQADVNGLNQIANDAAQPFYRIQMPRAKLAKPPFSPDVDAIFDRLPREWGDPFALFTAMADDPRLLHRYVSGAVSYLNPSHISVRERELLLLRTTARAGCGYEWGLRVHFFQSAADLSDEQIMATACSAVCHACWNDDDRLILRLADELHLHAKVSDDLWAPLRLRFEQPAIVQMLMMAGYYRTTAYIANGLELPPEPLAVPLPEGFGDIPDN
jgi:alkylhydroperoxidase family enzyme